LRTNEQLLVIAISFILGVLLYILAVLSAFGAKRVSFVIVTLAFIGGLRTLVLGYGSVIIRPLRVVIALYRNCSRKKIFGKLMTDLDDGLKKDSHYAAEKYAVEGACSAYACNRCPNLGDSRKVKQVRSQQGAKDTCYVGYYLWCFEG